MLTHGERRMNMLTPDRANKVLNADLETGKVVSEWGFQKDGVDVEMRDVTNDTKAAQTDDRDTFLGIGQNRWAPDASSNRLRCCICRTAPCRVAVQYSRHEGEGSGSLAVACPIFCLAQVNG